jgi:lipopolysaccharide transport system ATP-binding protein
MSDTVIKAENLGKQYTIGHQATNGRYLALRDVLVQNARSFWRSTKDMLRGNPIILGNDLEEIWALKDVSFEIQRGEAVGIIGRNGAGKSTLLKVLSRITEPSAGRVTIKGRVASLLEVGTGFHPELTGRENIYLNGAILGMTRAEVKRKFDEIVAFAEVEKFLDTPVKRYSSGMYVRLAFAVAAHLEPEILLVDEVLAVGDAAFQTKCLGKMGDVAKEGRTVLFVSHNLGAVNSLCSRGLFLNCGSIGYDGPVSEALTTYTASLNKQSVAQRLLESLPRRQSSDLARLKQAELTDSEGRIVTTFKYGDTLRLRLCFSLSKPLRVAVEVFLKTAAGESVALFASSHFQGLIFSGAKGNNEVELVIPALPLARGRYFLDIGISVPKTQWLDYVESAVFFDIEFSDPGKIGYDFRAARGFGVVYIEHSWIRRDPD